MPSQKRRITPVEVLKIIQDNFGDTNYLPIEQYLQLLELTGLNKINLSYHLRKLKIDWKKRQKTFKDLKNVVQKTFDFVEAEQAVVVELTEEQKVEKAKNDEEKSIVERKKIVEKVLVFLSRARTVEAINHKFGKVGMEIFQEFCENNPDGFVLKQGESSYNETTYYFEQIVNGCTEIKTRIFTVTYSDNDRDYLAITFPQDLDFSKNPEDSAIRIIPIDSVTFGDHLCDLDAFKEVLRRAATKPYVFLFFNGNIIGGSLYNEFTAVELRREFKSLIAPVAHKILWAQSGTVEDSASRVDGIDPLRDVCFDLGIHHTVRPVRADVYWKNPLSPIEFYAIHGRSGARQDGSKLNAILEVAKNQSFPHFTVMGHLEEAIVDDSIVYSADPSNNRVKESKSYLIICPGFRTYAGSTREIKGYTPPVSGRVECIIHSDNTPEATL